MASFQASAHEIFEVLKPLGVEWGPDCSQEATLTQLCAVEDSSPGALVFVDKKDFVEHVLSKKPSAVVTSPQLKNSFPGFAGSILVTKQVGLAHALLKEKYTPRDYQKLGWPRRHPSAAIHETAQIDDSSIIEPQVVIAQNVKIGKNCRVMAGSVIENDVVIGDDSIIRPKVVIGYGTRIGSRVDIGSGTVIGSEGFGFAQDEKRRSHAIPQTGIVVIEDDVRIGANNCVDRAAYHQTKIGRGTKTDNLCHIAHNVQIGEDCLLTAMLCIAGSSKIGDRVITSGQTGILDHVSVGSDTVLLHRAGVTKDLETPGAYAGVPLLPLSEYLKNMAVFKNLSELRKKISELEKGKNS